MVIYEGYQIKPNKLTPQHVIIVTDGKGGKIPDVLSGIFTSYSIAKQAIDDYLKIKQPRGKENGEAVNKGGSQ